MRGDTAESDSNSIQNTIGIMTQKMHKSNSGKGEETEWRYSLLTKWFLIRVLVVVRDGTV